MTKVANVPSGEERGETDVFTGYDRSIHEELTWLFIVCETVFTIGESQAMKQNSKHKNAEFNNRLLILAGEDLTPKNPLERERRLEI